VPLETCSLLYSRFPVVKLQVLGITCPVITYCPYLYSIFRLFAWHVLFEWAAVPKSNQMLMHCDVWTWVIDEWQALYPLVPNLL
jgi:hypothetical protein